MAKLPKDWERRLVELAAVHGVTDFIARGRLTKAESKLFFGILNRIGPPAVSTAGRLAGTTAMGIGRALPAVGRGVRFVTMRHPYITAAVVTYEVIKNREQIEQLAREGWEVISDTATAMAPIVETEFERLMTEGPRPIGAPLPIRKKRKSKYNRAMSSAMKAVKASSLGGKKGTLSNPKATFKTVSKAVSRVNRGLKVATTGISGIAARAARKIIKKPKTKAKKGRRSRY